MKHQRLLTWLLSLLIGVSAMSAQTYTMKGTVEDASGEPLIGASVLVKGTQSGLMTDIDGNFAIEVSNGQTLVFTYVGYNPQEIAVTGQNNIKVVMTENSNVLEDVVVIGYGTARKKDLTGSVVQIHPDKIADQNPGSVQDLLRGTPGLQIGYDSSAKGQGSSIRLRGQNSLGTEASPMIVLDGMPFYGELSEIQPDDIAQIDVLKDASSAAIYGARAAAGVIIITTKKGKEGKPTITVSANLAVSNKAKYHDYMDLDEYMQYRQDYYKTINTYALGENGLYGYYNKMVNGQLSRPVGYYDDPSNLSGSALESWMYSTGSQGFGAADGESARALWGRRLEFNNSPLAYENFIAGRTYDWNDATFRTGFKQDYSGSISGATENVNYYFSLGYMDNKGSVRGSEYSAMRASMKLNAKITSWLEVGANANFQDRTDGDIPVQLRSEYWYSNMLRLSPYAVPFDEEGNAIQDPMSGTLNQSENNYYYYSQYRDLDKGYTTLNSIFNLKATLPFGFTYTFNIAPRLQWFHDRYWMSADFGGASAASTGVNRENKKTYDWNLNNTLMWDRTFNDIHRFTVTLVQEAEEHKSWKDRIEARNISPNDILGFHFTDGGNKSQSNFSTYDDHSSAASYLGRFFYSFDNRYLLTASFRRDGFSGFGVNNKWGNFGSVGLGWNFADEKFMESTRSWLDNAKLRVSWGTNGNRDFGDIYKTLANLKIGGTMVYYNNGNSTLVKSLYMDRMAAPNLRWERTEAWNVGLDFGIFNSRLTGNIDWYHKATKDMIMNQQLPEFSGFKEIAANLGQVNNDGFELSLSSINIDNRDFQWNTTFGISYNKSKIVHIDGKLDEDGNEQDYPGNGWFIGKPIGEMWDYQADGVWQNTPEDIAEAAKYGQVPGDPKILNLYTEDDAVDKNGNVTPVYNDKDKVFMGTNIPPIYWTLRNEFVLWKDLTFSFAFYGYAGHKNRHGWWMNNDNGGSMVTNAFNVPSKPYWTPDNPSNEVCRLMSQGPSSLRGGVNTYYNASFARLDNITIGYTIPQKWSRKAQIERIRVTAACKNVCTIGGYKYADPETYGLSNREFNFGVTFTL